MRPLAISRTEERSQLQKINVVALVISLLCVPVVAFAQDSIRNDCGDCTQAVVSVPLSPVGMLQAASREPALFAMPLASASQQQQPLPPQPRSWFGQHPILAGALIGAGSGYVLSAIAFGDNPFQGTDEDATAGSRFVFGFLGIPVGALFGAAVGHVVGAITR
jgi:hypothetical protein